MQIEQDNTSMVMCAATQCVGLNTTLIIDRSEMCKIIFYILRTFRKSNIELYKFHDS